MNQDTAETQAPLSDESRPWGKPVNEQDEDSIDEVIRYTLDEIRFA